MERWYFQSKISAVHIGVIYSLMKNDGNAITFSPHIYKMTLLVFFKTNICSVCVPVQPDCAFHLTV